MGNNCTFIKLLSKSNNPNELIINKYNENSMNNFPLFYNSKTGKSMLLPNNINKLQIASIISDPNGGNETFSLKFYKKDFESKQYNEDLKWGIQTAIKNNIQLFHFSFYNNISIIITFSRTKNIKKIKQHFNKILKNNAILIIENNSIINYPSKNNKCNNLINQFIKLFKQIQNNS